MTAIVAEALIARLAQWGVDAVFGLPGDGINGIMEGLRRNRDKICFVLVHHEEAAAFMAAGYAKATGRVGVCRAASGPGGIHLANGLYDIQVAEAGKNPWPSVTPAQHAPATAPTYLAPPMLPRGGPEPRQLGDRAAATSTTQGDTNDNDRGLQ